MRMPETFQPRDVRRFRFVDYDLDESTLTARFHYAFDDGPHLCEEITFDGGQLPSTEAGRAALDRALAHLHLVAGISYYKAAVPPDIAVETGPLPRQTARFLDKLYLLGLGEFAYRNDLDLRDRIRFPFSDDVAGAMPRTGRRLPLARCPPRGSWKCPRG